MFRDRELSRTFVIDAEHQRASVAVEERADILGHGARQVRVEVASTQLELTAPRLSTDVLTAHVVLHSTHLPTTVALPAPHTETETN